MMNMTTEHKMVDLEARFSLPLDVREWVGECRLLEWVEEEVDRLEWDSAEVLQYLEKHPEYRPRMMLCLLTYAYITQVLGADEIVRRCYSDTVFRLICENGAPTADAVSRFRREHRALLKSLLARVLLRALSERHELGREMLPAGLKRYLVNNAIERLDIARHMDCLED